MLTAAVAAALVAACTLAWPAAAQCNAGIQYFPFGSWPSAAVVSDGMQQLPVSAIHPTQTALANRALARRGFPTGIVNAGNNIVYLDTGDEKIIIDTGNGPASGALIGYLVPTLEAQGIAASDITRVLLTHAHPDHILGVLTANGTSAFPAATIHISEAEYAYWRGTGVPLSKSEIPQEVLQGIVGPINDVLDVIEEQLEFFAIGDEVLPNITATAAAPWHTPGSTIFRAVADDGTALYALGDAVGHEVLAVENPYLEFFFDSYRAEGTVGRIALLEALADEKALTVPCHTTFPALGYVLQNGLYFDLQKAPPVFSAGVMTSCPA